MINALAIILHLVAINIWVGGMFFIIIVLGKVAGTLEVEQQNIFWEQILKRFFTWIWLAVIILLSTGTGMIVYRFGDISHAPIYILVMGSLGSLMAVVFFIIYFVFYQRFKLEMQKGNVQASRQQLRMIRRLGIINMALGFCVVIVIGSGPYLFSLI